MGHQFQQGGVVIAGDRHASVVLEDETGHLAHLLYRETGLGHAQVQFAYQAPCYGIAVEYGLALECQ